MCLCQYLFALGSGDVADDRRRDVRVQPTGGAAPVTGL